MSLIKMALNNIIRPVLLRYGKGWPDRLAFERFFKERTRRAIPENLELQKQRLYSLLMYSIENIPYYKKAAEINDIKLSIETIEEDLRKFPILTKDIIRREFNNLKLEIPESKAYENTSGGSTGIPVKLVQDKKYRQENPTLILDGFTGYEFGDKIVQLWGSEKDIIQGSIGIKNIIINKFFYRKLMLNSFRMSQEDMLKFVKKINAFKPKYMLAYVQSAYELARFIQYNKLAIHQMDGIIVSAGTLYEDFREMIEKVFKCPVFNRYGSREVGNMAMECEKHEGLHLNVINHYIEIINDMGEPVKYGEAGKIIITLLSNYTMPLIRFEIGDIGIPSNHICSCGRGLPLLENVKGRTVNVFKTRDGTLIDGEYFTHLFYELDFIKQFQVVQEAFDCIDVKYALSKDVAKGKLDAVCKDMTEKIKLVMGNECKVKFIKLEEILPTDSGKYIYTVSKI